MQRELEYEESGEKDKKMICKSCGAEILEDTYEEFNGRCCNCDEIYREEIEEIERREAGE